MSRTVELSADHANTPTNDPKPRIYRTTLSKQTRQPAVRVLDVAGYFGGDVNLASSF
jgi:hypothetical protein